MIDILPRMIILFDLNEKLYTTVCGFLYVSKSLTVRHMTLDELSI